MKGAILFTEKFNPTVFYKKNDNISDMKISTFITRTNKISRLIVTAVFTFTCLFISSAVQAQKFAVQTGNWTGSIWAATANGIAGSAVAPVAGDAVTINSGINVTINTDLSATSYTSTLTIAGSGTLTITSSGKYTRTTGTVTFNGTGAGLIQIAGTYTTSATAVPTFTNLSGKLQIASGGIMAVTAAGGTIFATTSSANVQWDNGAILDFNTGGNPSFNTTYFPNVDASTVPIFRLTASSGSSITSTGLVMNGIFENNKSGLSLTQSSGATAILRNGLRGSGSLTLTASSATGTYLINGTTAELGGTGTLTINANGNLVVANGTTCTLSGNKTVNTGSMFVSGGLIAGTNVISGTGNFTLAGTTVITPTAAGTSWANAATTITVSSAAGIVPGMLVTAAAGIAANTYVSSISGTTVTISKATTAIGSSPQTVNFTPAGSFSTANVIAAGALSATGSIQVTGGTRSFSPNADYTFNGATAQVSSTSFTGARNLTVANSGGLTLTNSTNPTIAGVLTLSSGKLSIGTNTLNLAGTVASMSATNSLTGGAASLVNITGTGALGSLFFDQATPGTTNNLTTLTINRTTSGTVTLSNALNVSSALNLADGAFTTGTNLTIGTGATITRTASTATLSQAPTFAGTVNVTYNNAAAINTDVELPTSATALTNLSTAGGSNTVSLTADATVNGTLTVSGSNFTVNGGKNLTLKATGGTALNNSKTLLVTGTLTNATSGSPTILNSNTLTINGKYIHARDGGGFVASVTWGSGSTCEITGVTNAVPGTTLIFNSAIFYNFTWNCSGQALNLGLGGQLVAVMGTLDIQNTNGFEIRLVNTQSPAIAIGILDVSGSTGTAKLNLTSGTGVPVVTAGSVNIGATGTLNCTGANGGTLKVNTTFTNSGTFTAGTSTVDFSGTISQTIPALNFNNLTISGNKGGNATVLVNGGTIGIAGVFSKTATNTTYTVAGNTVDFNGGAQNIPTFTFNNLTASGTADKTMTGDVTAEGTLNLNGRNIIINGNILQLNGGTSGANTITGSASSVLSLGGSSAQAISFTGGSQSLFWLDVSKSSGTATLGTPVTISDELSLNGGILGDGGNIITLAGNLTGTATHSGAGKIAMTGSGKTISGATLGNLELNNVAGFTLTGSPTVNGTLTFTAGKLTTSTNTLTIGAAGSVTGAPANGWVIGNLAKTIAAALDPTYSFEIGSNGTNYTPISIALTGNITNNTGVIRTNTTGIEHPNIATSAVDGGKNANRYWTITNPSAITGLTSYAPTFTFINPGDLDAPAVGLENTFIVDRWNGSAWVKPTVGSRTSTSTQATGITLFSDFVVGVAKNNTPSFNNGSPQSLTVCNGTTSINSLLAATDADGGQTLTWSVTSAPNNGGSLSGFNATAPTTGGSVTPAGLSYTPANGYTGAESFTIQVSDGTGVTTTIINATVSQNSWTGAGDGVSWTDQNNWSCGVVPGTNANISIDNGDNPVLNTSHIVGPSGRLILNPTSTLTISGSGRLSKDAGGTIDFNNQHVTVKSTLTATGSIGQILGSSIADATNVTVERHIRQNNFRAWRLLSVPAAGQTINGAWQEGATAPGVGVIPTAISANNPNPGFGTIISTSAGYTNTVTLGSNGFDYNTPGNSILSFDGTNWVPGITSTTGTAIASEQGYMLFVRGDRSIGIQSSTNQQEGSGGPTVLRTTGTISQGTLAGVTVTDGAAHILVGNKYASAIDFTTVLSASTGIKDEFQVWDPAVDGGSPGLGAYVVFKGDDGYVPFPDFGKSYTLGAPNTRIESGSAFFVADAAAGGGGSVVLTEAAKVSGSNNVYRPANITNPVVFTSNLFMMKQTGRALADGNKVKFDEVYSDEVDNDDAIKMSNFGINFGILRGDKTLIIESRKPVTAEDVLPFKMWNLSKSDYELELTATGLAETGVTAILEDRYTGSSKVLDMIGKNVYSFTVNTEPGSSASDRLRVVFQPSATVPVRFTALNAFQKNADIQVDWKLATENGISRYEVEHSLDGRNFTKSGTVAAANAGSYSWLDVQPAAGTHYYRIKGIGVAGDAIYTSIVKVLVGKGRTGITVYPNPVKDGLVTLQFTNQAAGKYGIRLINDAGQSVYRSTTIRSAGNGSETFSLPKGITKGIYKLEVITPGNKTSVEKIIIN